jgi:O-acetylhomoserine/O-acetylserine sulfhydrylase-like pyridoxal-dependent enzyme
MQHTHSELTDKFYRRILANELLVLRASLRQVGESMNSDYAYGVRTGLDTFARRLQAINTHGLEWVYRQNNA